MDKLPERASLLAPPKAAGASAHSDLNTTLSIYSHQNASDLNRAMEKQADAKAVRDSEAVTPNRSPRRSLRKLLG
jgi:hypothetical protein